MVFITVVAIDITDNRYYKNFPLSLDGAEGNFLCSGGATGLAPAAAGDAVGLAGRSIFQIYPSLCPSRR